MPRYGAVAELVRAAQAEPKRSPLLVALTVVMIVLMLRQPPARPATSRCHRKC